MYPIEFLHILFISLLLRLLLLFLFRVRVSFFENVFECIIFLGASLRDFWIITNGGVIVRRLDHANLQVLLLFEDNQIGATIQVLDFFFFMLTSVLLRGVALARGTDFPADLDSVQVVALAGEFEKLLGHCVGDFGEQLLGEEVHDVGLLQLAHVVDECVDGQLMWLP